MRALHCCAPCVVAGRTAGSCPSHCQGKPWTQVRARRSTAALKAHSSCHCSCVPARTHGACSCYLASQPGRARLKATAALTIMAPTSFCIPCNTAAGRASMDPAFGDSVGSSFGMGYLTKQASRLRARCSICSAHARKQATSQNPKKRAPPAEHAVVDHRAEHWLWQEVQPCGPGGLVEGGPAVCGRAVCGPMGGQEALRRRRKLELRAKPTARRQRTQTPSTSSRTRASTPVRSCQVGAAPSNQRVCSSCWPLAPCPIKPGPALERPWCTRPAAVNEVYQQVAKPRGIPVIIFNGELDRVRGGCAQRCSVTSCHAPVCTRARVWALGPLGWRGTASTAPPCPLTICIKMLVTRRPPTGGYYPSLFFSELAKLTAKFIPLFTQAYYIHSGCRVGGALWVPWGCGASSRACRKRASMRRRKARRAGQRESIQAHTRLVARGWRLDAAVACSLTQSVHVACCLAATVA